MRVSEKAINPSLKKEINKLLAQTIADIRDPKEAVHFLRDFFNDSEAEVFAKRLAIAYWLKKGRSYNNIKNNLKVSSATVATVQSLISTPGFKTALKKVEAEEWANVWAEKIKKLTKLKK